MDKYQIRKYIVQTIFLITALIILSNAAWLQLFSSDFRERAEKTTLHKRTLFPSRGIIYDRNDKLLVFNEPAYNLDVIYNEIDEGMDTVFFCQLLNIDKETFINNIEKNWRSPLYNKTTPFSFIKRIDPEDFAKFQEHLYKFPGFYPTIRNVRSYPHQNAANVLGYLGEADEEKIKSSDGIYSLGDYIGITGLEKMYESELKGQKGIEYLLKDNLGREVSSLSEDRKAFASEGVDITASIDLDLQKYGEELMANKRGSIVAIEPSTGEILAMVSAPSYDPNLLRVDRDRGKAYAELNNDTINRPFLDRSVQANYPPGSIFKPIFALIAMQERYLWPYRSITCTGEYEVTSRGFSQGCHDHPHPSNVKTALAYSCNTYFYQVMREFINGKDPSHPEIGMDKLNEYLKEFKVGEKTGVDNQFESSGFFPDGKYYSDLYLSKGERRWFSTMVLSLGIGQGEINVTTLQMANLASILANKGYFYTPHLLKSYRGSQNLIPEEFAIKHQVPIDSTYFPFVNEGLERVIREGTAQIAFVPGMRIAGKTGTSQNSGKDHSVFFGFAPVDNPKIAVAVYVENGGWGSQYAAPIASLMIEKYMNKDIRPNRKYLETRMKEADLLSIP